MIFYFATTTSPWRIGHDVGEDQSQLIVSYSGLVVCPSWMKSKQLASFTLNLSVVFWEVSNYMANNKLGPKINTFLNRGNPKKLHLISHARVAYFVKVVLCYLSLFKLLPFNVMKHHIYLNFFLLFNKNIIREYPYHSIKWKPKTKFSNTHEF